MRWKGSAAAAAGLLVAAAAIGWTWRLDVARMAAIRLLESGGFGPVGLTVGAIDLGGLHARDISLFGGAVRVEALTLSFDPRQAVTGVLADVTITRPRVAVTVTEAGVDVGGFAFSGNAGGPSILDRVRIDALRIVEAQVTIKTPAGPWEAAFSTEVAVDGPRITGAARATVPLMGGLDIDAPVLALSLADGGVGARVSSLRTQCRIWPVRWGCPAPWPGMGRS